MCDIITVSTYSAAVIGIECIDFEPESNYNDQAIDYGGEFLLTISVSIDKVVWSKQAKFAAAGRMAELKKLQAELKNGVTSK